MTELQKIQSDFQAFVVAAERGADRHVIGSDTASKEERLDVYYQAYRLRLLEVLEADFPGLRALTDKEEFRRLGCGYVDAHPSSHPSVRWLGRHLSTFLDSTAPYHQRPVLAEMASFEWARGLAFDGPDDAVVDVAELGEIADHAWPGLRFEFHGTLQRLTLNWNVPNIWYAVKVGDDMPEPEPTEETVWLLWRRNLDVYRRSVTADEAWALETFAAGKDFSEICIGLCRWFDEADVPSRGAGFLKQWANDGLISKILIS